MNRTRNAQRMILGTIAAGLLITAPAMATGTLMGDMNGDGVVSWRDIDLFVAAMNNTSAGHVEPIAYYPLDGSARNYGALRNHGTEEAGVTYIDGMDGDAAYFDGTTYIDTNYVPTLFADDSITFAFWAQTPTEPPSETHAVPVGLDIEYNQQITLKIEEDTGKARLTFWDDEYTPAVAETSEPVTDGEWHHFICVRDTNQNQIRFYVDGVLADEDNTALSHPINAAQAITLYIGASHRVVGQEDQAINYYNGPVDEVYIFDRVLSEEQIMELSAVPQ